MRYPVFSKEKTGQKIRPGQQRKTGGSDMDRRVWFWEQVKEKVEAAAKGTLTAIVFGILLILMFCMHSIEGFLLACALLFGLIVCSGPLQ